MDEFHYIFVAVTMIGTVAAFPLALIMLIPLYTRPKEPPVSDAKLRNMAWSLWTIWAVCLTYVASFILDAGDSDAVRDLDWWIGYFSLLGAVFTLTFLPAGIYWFRLFRTKGRS